MAGVAVEWCCGGGGGGVLVLVAQLGALGHVRHAVVVPVPYA